MTNRRYGLSMLLILALSACNATKESSNSEQSEAKQLVIETLFNAANQADMQHVNFVNSNGNVVSSPSNGLKVHFNNVKDTYAGIEFIPETPWDWSQYNDFNLAFDIANHGVHSVQLYLDITDIDGANYTRTVNVPVDSSNTYYAKMAGHDLATSIGNGKVELNFTSGLRSNPDTWDSGEEQFTSMWGKKNLNLKGIKRISLSVQSALFDKEVVLSSIQLRTNPPMNTAYLTKIVDRFGQNANLEYDGKIKNEAELIQRRDEEAASFTGDWSAPRSKWGGWLNGPKLEGTGNFRTEKVGSTWSLVDPDGYLYFATGLDIIRLANSTTMTGYDFPTSAIKQRSSEDTTPEDSQGFNRASNDVVDERFVASELRKDMFKWLPKYDEPLSKHYGYRQSAHSGPLEKGETYSFYSANLDRKYTDVNPDFMQQWRDVTVDRMVNWGFTSLGNWTDPTFYDNKNIPFFANGWIIGKYKTVSSGNDFWSPLPDVFDPLFEQRALYTAGVIAKEVQKTPWCVGVFVDNEMSFGRSETKEAQYGIVINTLTRDGSTSPTKAEFTRIMKNKYTSIANLNNAWGKQIDSWEEFDAGIDSTITNSDLLQDYSDLLYVYAAKYYSTVRNSVKKYLPNHMYLGSRLPDWGMPIEVVKAAAKYADVISFNIYKEGVHPKKWAFLEEIDRPAIIGEFHFGAKDSGVYHPGLIHASDQNDRAKMYTDYMHSVIDNPYFIGAHWFQYMDSPITGRAYDGENYNVGFVSVTDTPYKPMVNAAKTLHNDMYERRFKDAVKEFFVGVTPTKS